VPVTTKVNIDQVGCPTDNGVVAYRDNIATEDHPVVANLRRAGAIIIGRTDTPAFSMRAFADNALHGRTLNPLDPALSAGGSSGGAGAAVATGIGPLDTRWSDAPLAGPPVPRPIAVALVPQNPGGYTHPAQAEAVRQAGRHLAPRVTPSTRSPRPISTR
jgi:hypothetical protein